MRAFVLSVAVAFVMLSALADKPAMQHVATATVAEVHEDWILVANQHTRFPVALGEATAYEGDPVAIKPGVRVTVWYRSVAERRFVADRVSVLSAAATR